MSEDKYGSYIDIKSQNGRLFYNFINKNFKKYQLEEILNISDDPCNAPNTENTTNGVKEVKKKLRKYQEFVAKYLDYRSPYKNILIYHGLGTGKTSTAINVYNMLYSYTPGWNVFILIKSSLRDGWMSDLKEWLGQDDYKNKFKNIVFINYDSPIADKTFLNAIKNTDSAKKSLYIIDEVHNFIRNVYSNVTTGQGRRGQVIYDYIQQDKKNVVDTRVVLLSGTPVINNPFELALLFNLLQPDIFPKVETEFNRMFVTTDKYRILKKNKINQFKISITDIVFYYIVIVLDMY